VFVGLLFSTLIAIAVVGVVAWPHLRQGATLLTPEGEQRTREVVGRVKETSSRIFDRFGGSISAARSRVGSARSGQQAGGLRDAEPSSFPDNRPGPDDRPGPGDRRGSGDHPGAAGPAGSWRNDREGSPRAGGMDSSPWAEEPDSAWAGEPEPSGEGPGAEHRGSARRSPAAGDDPSHARRGSR